MIEIGKKYYILRLQWEEIETKAEVVCEEDYDNYEEAEYGFFLKDATIVEGVAKRYVLFSYGNYYGKGLDYEQERRWKRQRIKNRLVSVRNYDFPVTKSPGQVLEYDEPCITPGKKQPCVILFSTRKDAIKKLLSFKEEFMKRHWANEDYFDKNLKIRKENLEAQIEKIKIKMEEGRIKRMSKTSSVMQIISKYEEELKTA